MDTREWLAAMLFLATGLMLFVAVLSYRRRYLPVAGTMALTMLAAAFYACGYAFELLSRNLYEVKLSLHIQYFGIPFVTVLWFFQAIQFTGKAARYRKRLVLLLFIVPAAIFFLHLTNDWHHLIYERYNPTSEASILLYTTDKGIGYAVHAIYSYSILLCGLLLFISAYLRAAPPIRKQIAILLLGAIAPMVLNLLLLAGITVDLTPFGFAASGVAYMWGILRFNLLRLTPLAMAKVFESVRDGVVLFDYEDRIVSFNHAAQKALPELGGAILPVRMEEVLSASPELLEHIRHAPDGDERFPFRKAHANRISYYTCSLSLLYDSGTILIGKILMFNDITALKESEERERENARRLLELNAFKDKLFTVVAHDIRDPIALLVNLTELIGDEDTESDPEKSELIRELQGQVRNTFHLVENLLGWYRSQNGRVAYRPTDWNVQQVVRQALLISGKRADMKRIRLIESIDNRLAVHADKEMLDLILRNLLSNAIKYTRVGMAVKIEAVREGDVIVISVHDDGPGIDEQTAEWLHQEEPFFKISASGDAGETRFGLALAREFVRIHGGNLWFKSQPGAGTTFCFTLLCSSDLENTVDRLAKEEHADESYRGGR